MNSIIVDIDGTIADNSHRQHYLEKSPKDWESFYNTMQDDKPIYPIIYLIQHLNFRLLFCTGRPETYRETTTNWLFHQGLNPKYLYMRKDNDYRPDYIVKSEVLQEIHNDGFNPIVAIDDRQSVVDMWRSKGIICLQNEPRII